jgi:hypothetical protein
MITQLRLAFRLQRFEIVALAIAVGIVAIAAVLVRSRLDATAVTPDCWLAWFGSGGPGSSVECDGPVQAFLTINESEAGKVMASMALLPLAVGLFLGVPLVAREIETGTASTAWYLSASRGRWLIGRVVPVLVVALVLLGTLAVASEILWAGREPWSPAVRWSDAGLHGPVVVGKGLAMFGLALLAGAILGRVLPAVIVGLALCLVVFIGDGMAVDAWLQNEAPKHVVVLDPAGEGDLGASAFPGGTYFSQWWRTPEGELLDNEQAYQRAPGGVDQDQWLSANFESVMTGVPGSVYPDWARLETAGFGLIGLGAIALAFPVVNRRRPQ